MSVLQTNKHDQPVTSVEIWQVKEDLPDRHNIIFCSKALLEKLGVAVNSSLYNKVWEQPADHIDPEEIFYIFNAQRPMGYTGHSLSVSDMVVYKNGEDVVKSLFCDSIGFVDMPDFFEKTEKEMQIERIGRRFGNIYNTLYEHKDDIHLISSMSREQALKMGESALKSPELQELIKGLIEFRGDMFTSDREIMALAVALDAEGISVEIVPSVIEPSVAEDPEFELKRDIVNALIDEHTEATKFIQDEARHLLDNGLSPRTKEGRIHTRNKEYVEHLGHLLQSTKDVFYRDDRRFTVEQWLNNVNNNLEAYSGNPKASRDGVITLNNVNNGYELKAYDGMYGAAMNVYKTIQEKKAEHEQAQMHEQNQSRSVIRRQEAMDITH